MNRKLFMLVTLALALCLVVPGSAQAARGDREELNYGYVDAISSQVDKVLVAKPCYVYAVTVYPTEGLATVKLYDHETTSTDEGDYVKVEITESAAYATTREVFNPPIRMNKGVYADITNGQVVLEYR